MNGDMKRILAIAGIISVGLLIVVSVALLPVPGKTGPDRANDTIRVGMPPLEQGTLIYVAMDRGFFERSGLNVTVRDDYPNGVGPVNDMSQGALDLSVSAEYPVIARILSGEDIAIVATIDKYQNEELIARMDGGIRSPADLKGKTIGLPRGTVLEFFLGRLLERHGMSIRDVTLVNLTADDAAGALVGGRVDAVMYFQPHIGKILAEAGKNLQSWPAQSDQPLFGVVAARNGWIREDPERIERFLLSLEEARRFMIDNPGETRSIVRTHMNVTDEYLAGVLPDHQVTLCLDQSLVLAMNDEGRWMIANNLSRPQVLPDFRKHIFTQGLSRVRPGAVNIR